jgi:hypothetical protein
MRKAYKDTQNVRDTTTQDGNHSECVSLPMEYGSPKTRLANHPKVGYISHFWFRFLSYRPLSKSVQTVLTGFLIDNARERGYHI